ncbi:MAG TPA: ribosome recycling factor [Chloroflexota bacterium]|nr:ribosome recycling factor [Chloroflexota bacterium]
MQDVVDRAETKMKHSIEALRKELTSIRTGRASPGLVDSVHVEYYGTETPLKQLANISVPEARTLVIQPYDRNAIGPIEKAIQKSDLGLTPNNDGAVIRLTIPRLTEERRKDLVKVVRKQLEEGRVSVRNVRREAIDHLKELEKAKTLSADDEKRAQERLQRLTDTYVKQIDDIGHAKEAEVMEV